MGMPPNIFRGNFTGEVLALTCQDHPDASGYSRATFDLSKKIKYAFRMEVSPDGNQWFPLIEGGYTRENR
jgi:hypothetical protein